MIEVPTQCPEGGEADTPIKRDDGKCKSPAIHEKYSDRGIEDQCPYCHRSPADYGVY